MTTKATPTASLPRQGDWDWANWLIEQLEEEERSDRMVAVISSWHTAVKAVRRIEHERIYSVAKPNKLDLQCHRTCLASLISGGESILITMEGDCSEYSPADIEAEVHGLRHSYDEWHSMSPTAQERLKPLKEAIFNG